MRTKEITLQDVLDYLKEEGFQELTKEQEESEEFRETIASCERILAGDDD
jgi:hypothetical protein